MKLEVFIIRNKKLKCTGQPIFDDHTPENFAKGFERMLLTAQPEKVFQYTNCALYHLASYDDESMVLTAREPELLVDCDFILEDRNLKQEVFAKANEIKAQEEKKEDLDNVSCN